MEYPLNGLQIYKLHVHKNRKRSFVVVRLSVCLRVCIYAFIFAVSYILYELLFLCKQFVVCDLFYLLFVCFCLVIYLAFLLIVYLMMLSLLHTMNHTVL
jgi:hypothetical protein